jgi:uncharacterized membrane protein
VSGPFWLSHHAQDELHRCYRLGTWAVCARCLGTYPVLLASMGLQFAARAPLTWPLDDLVGTALLVPALLDWAIGRFRPRAGCNALRTTTGALLGAGLGRSLYIHVQHPLPPLLGWQTALVTAVALPVILAAYWRTRRR